VLIAKDLDDTVVTRLELNKSGINHQVAYTRSVRRPRSSSPSCNMRWSLRRLAGSHNPNERMPHGWEPVKLDPAVERWAYMRENVYTTFKFTTRNTPVIILYMVVVPYGLYKSIEWSMKSYDLRPSRRGTASPKPEK